MTAYVGAALHTSMRSSWSTDETARYLDDKFAGLLHKYGLGDGLTEEKRYEFMRQDARRYGFYLELMGFLQEVHHLNQKARSKAPGDSVEKSSGAVELKNIVITGERAEAVLANPKLKEEDQRVIFRKEKGVWLIDVPPKRD